jgi:hypothetical protein
MKLVLISDAFPPSKTSAAVQLGDLTREFCRQGYEVTVLLSNSKIKKPWTLSYYEGAKIVHLKSPPTKDLGYVRRTINEFLMPFSMRKNLKRSPIDVHNWDGVIWYSPSIFHSPLVKYLKLKSKCPGYLVIRDIFPEWALDLGLIKKRLPYYFFKLIARQQYNLADIIGVQTEGNLEYFKEWQQTTSKRLLEVLPNWLDKPSTVRSQLRVEDTHLSGRKIFVYAGNMGVAQGAHLLIDLAFRVKYRSDIGFLFVGRGRDVPRLRERARDLALDNILFHDEINSDEIPDLYNQCTAGMVALDPRHKSHNIPGKFLTYMQNGLPVLANINPGNDLANLIRREQVGEVSESNQLNDLEDKFNALLNLIDTEKDINKKCTSLFYKLFYVSKTTHQITSALNTIKNIQ